MAEWYKALFELKHVCANKAGSNQTQVFSSLLQIFAFSPNFEGKFPVFAKFREVGS